MAVQAGQQFLQNPALLNNNGDGSGIGWVDGSGELPVGLCRRPLQQQQQQQHQVAATMAACSSGLANQQVFPAELSCSLASQVDKEEREIDQFLCLQSERLRVALQQQMKHHLLSLVKTLESKASALLRRKEEELARASKTAAELEERLRQSEAERQAWQRVARENECMALALSSALEQLRGNARLSPESPPDTADSCCSSSPHGGEPEAWGRCRGCGAQGARVLFFPCMHLCACELCAGLLAACPVCRCAKQGSMEVFIS